VRRVYDNSVQLIGANGVTVEKTGDDVLTIDASGATGFMVGALGDTGAGATPDANRKITWHGATAGYSFDAHDNQVDLTGPWTRFDAGGGDDALRPTEYADDIRIKADANTDVIWLEGDSGKSHFADDMFIGDAAGVADSKLHIKDNAAGRYGARITFETGAYKAQFGLSDDGEAFINTHQAQGISLQVNSVQKVYAFDDGSQVAFENGGIIAGYVGMSSTGGSPNDVMWSLDNSNGNLFLDEDALTTIGGYIYTWPKSGAALGEALTVGAISSNSITLDWATYSLVDDNGTVVEFDSTRRIAIIGDAYLTATIATVATIGGTSYNAIQIALHPDALIEEFAHDLLSDVHADTTPAAVVRGDVIVGQGASPTWARKALGAAGEFLGSDGNDVVYSVPRTAATVQAAEPATMWTGMIWVQTA